MRESLPFTRRVKRQLKGSLSSSSSDTSEFNFKSEETIDNSQPNMSSNQLQSPEQLDETFIEEAVKEPPQSYFTMNRDRNENSYMSDSYDSTCSETQILIQSAQVPVISPDEQFSIPLEDVQTPARRELSFRNSHCSLVLPEKTCQIEEMLDNESESSFTNEHTSSKRSETPLKSAQAHAEKCKLPYRKSRLSQASSQKTHMLGQALGNESESSLTDESISSSRDVLGFVEKEKQLPSLLKQKQLRMRQQNRFSPNQSESDSEVEENHNSKTTSTKRLLPKRTTRIPLKYQTFDLSSKLQSKPVPPENTSTESRMLTQRTLVQEKSNTKNRNDSQIKTTLSKADFCTNNLRVILKRTDVTPELLHRAQSKHTSKTNSPVANCNYEELGTKTLENHADIEDLLEQLVGSSSNDSDSIRSPIKTKSSPIKKKRTSLTKKPQDSDRFNNETQYICHVCHQCFTSMGALKRHDDLHSGKKNRKCKYCEKTFTRNDNYINHLRQHDINLKSHCINAFKCDICKKLFAYRHVLRRHQLMHENRADYKCKECGEKFVRLDYLRNHERLKHSNNPFYSCKYCDKEFRFKHSKKLHERTHENKKPYKCRFCTALFSRKDNAKKHQLSHEIKIAKYVCDDCDETFVNKFALQFHVQQHLKIKEKNCQAEVVQIFINEDLN